ncbi:MAG: SMP-30/gluconolactonase/LRE family protein [Deltaproteobacteria bacterium]|nr:SMP-30/gluconolactonase/LRE family protein [Deltaproteobacteria bacterium]
MREKILSRACLVLGCAIATVSCSKPGPLITHPASIRWPKAPSPARIRYVGQIRGEPAQRGGVAEVIAGEDEEHHDLARPYAATITRSGLLVITDPGDGQINIFDLKKRERRTIKRFKSEALRTPVGAATDGKGHIYVTDSTAAKVYVFTEGGEPVRILNASFGRPTGIAIDQHRGVVYVADTTKHRIQALSLEGKPLFTFGRRGAAPGQLNYPTHLAFDAKRGALWVCDTLNFRVQRFARRGEYISMFGRLGDSSGTLAKPKGMALDSTGNLYVADALFDTVQVFDEDGKLLLYFGQSGAGPGNLAMPTGIAIDAQNRIFVANTLNRRIEVFEYLLETAP